MGGGDNTDVLQLKRTKVPSIYTWDYYAAMKKTAQTPRHGWTLNTLS